MQCLTKLLGTVAIFVRRLAVALERGRRHAVRSSDQVDGARREGEAGRTAVSTMDPKILVQGLVAWMRREGVAPTRTRLMKFLYLSDLHYARHHDGTTITGWRWYVNSFGPMANEAYEVFDRGVTEGWLSCTPGTAFDAEGGGRTIFYDVADKNAGDRLFEVGKVHRWIKEFGDDTGKLLRFVYGNTDPMADAKEGDVLDFSIARPTDQVAPIRGRAPTRKEEKKFEELSKKLQARYKATLAANEAAVNGPRDAAYFEGLPADETSIDGDILLLFERGR